MQFSPAQRACLGHNGAICAVFGTVLSVSAGIGFRNLTNEADALTVLGRITEFRGFWPLLHLGFILGACFWLAALIILAESGALAEAMPLARIALGILLAGIAMLAVHSALSGFSLTRMAEVWSLEPPAAQADIVSDAAWLLTLLGGLWASVLMFFHGLPFALFGLALVFSHRYSASLGWLGFIGGAGSFLMGLLMFLDPGLPFEHLYFVFALLNSLWMLLLARLLWRESTHEIPLLQ
jgi:hypothetical protein